MTIFELFKTKNIDELAEWFDEYCYIDSSPWINYYIDSSPWINYFDKNYCKKCDGVYYDGDEYAWCEVNNGKCKYFQDMDIAPDNKQMIKLWLESEI